MNLLSAESLKRMDQYFKFVGQILTYKQFSYLSFFVNQKGDQLQYDQELNFAPLYRNPTHINKFSLEEYLDMINAPYIYRKFLLAGLFNNQILTEKETHQILKNCVHLELKSKKDMVNFMFGNRITFDIKSWFDNFKKGKFEEFSLNFAAKDGKLPDEKRKNFFIFIENEINDFSQLEQKIEQNDFFNIPNINKILCLDLRIENIHRFNNELLKKETLFKEKNIKIKNMASDKVPQIFEEKSLTLGFRVQKIFEYVAKNMRGGTLLHEIPEYYKFYKEAEKSESSMVSNLHRYEPKETFLFLQRKDVLEDENQYFTFEEFNTNFTKRFEKKDPYFEENESGLQTVRFLSKSNKAKNLKMIKMEEKGTTFIPME